MGVVDRDKVGEVVMDDVTDDEDVDVMLPVIEAELVLLGVEVTDGEEDGVDAKVRPSTTPRRESRGSSNTRPFLMD